MNLAQRFSTLLALVLIICFMAGCEMGGDDQIPLDPQRECIVTPGLCGGCDPACRTITDVPVRDEDVVSEGDNINAEDVVYDPDASGVTLGTAHGAGPDTDGDGLPDSSDPSPEDPHGDADGDGIPDGYEAFRGTNPLVPDPPPADNEWFFVLSQDGGPVWRDIPPDIPLSVRTADVYFLVDVTGSMGGEIANLRSTISTFIIPEIADIIENVEFGVGRFGDFPEHYRAWADEPYVNLVNITDDIASVQTAVNGLRASGGWDGPESQTAALHSIATGEGLDTDCNGIPDATCEQGRVGYPCFRAGAQPIIILFTDNLFHNGVYDTIYGSRSCYTYGSCSSRHCTPLNPPVPPLEDVVTELNDIGARVIGVYSGYYPYRRYGHISTWGSGYYTPLRWPSGLSYALDSYYTILETDSVDEDGLPFLYKISTNGTGLGSEVVDAVNDMVEMMLLQVNSRWSDTDPEAPDGSVLIQDVDPVECSNCASLDHVNNIAHDVYPGSSVTFQVHLENTAIPPGPEPQEFLLRVEILSNDTALLAERFINVLVPGDAGFNEPVDTGRYWQNYDSWISCEGGEEIPYWDQLYFDTTTPPGTEITFVIRTSNTYEGLDTATPITVATATGDSSPVAVDTALETAGILNYQRFVRVEAILTTEDTDISPVLHETTTVFYCVPIE